MEKVYGSFCPGCYAAVVQTSSSSRSRNPQGAPNYGLFIGLLVFALLAVGGIAVLLLLTR
jgi:hypothetical protein